MEFDNQDYENEDELIELIDDDGNSTMFEHIVTIEYNGDAYIMLVEESVLDYAEENGVDELDAVVMKIEQDKYGQDIYTDIEDDELAATVFEKCLEAIESEDFDD